jgi:G3E family GTPase
MTDERIRAFLIDTLALWGAAGTVEAGEAPVVALVRTDEDATISIERGTPPFRWIVRTERPRPCASLAGLLNALRAALGVERGSAVRVAPAPDHPGRSSFDSAATQPVLGSVEGLRTNEDLGDDRAAAVRPAHNAVESKDERPIPVSIITGFLGSGKTTLLARLLRDPGMSRTAVIMNEFGAIGLDHDLIETSDESFIRLSNGCLCCNVRSDLMLTLGDLAARRAAGTLPPFERVVVETTGLADPAPILHALMTDRDLAEVYALDGVVTTVDALTGLSTLEQHGESLRQAAVADRIVLTKTDVPGAQTEAIGGRLKAINPGAPILAAVRGAISPAALFDAGLYTAAGKHPDVEAWLAEEAHAAAGGHAHAHHRDDIGSFCIVRDEPLHAVTLALLLSALAENCGADLLRMKGIVRVVEAPDSPAVIHGVQHVYHAPVWLERWPSDDRRSRMVFIGRNLRESWVRAALDLLEAEVADESARRA